MSWRIGVVAVTRVDGHRAWVPRPSVTATSSNAASTGSNTGAGWPPATGSPPPTTSSGSIWTRTLLWADDLNEPTRTEHIKGMRCS